MIMDIGNNFSLNSFNRIPFKSMPHSKNSGPEVLEYNYGNLPHDKLGVLTSVVKKAPVKDRIIESKLQEIEKKHNVKIIYANESGSKAWGSDSKGSDFDVRFIYISPKYEYQNTGKRDHIQSELNEDYDLYGYDLNKVIGMIKKSNYTPLQWLNSPIKYRTSEVSDSLTDLANKHSDSSLLALSCLNLMKANYKKYTKDDEINPKIALLVLQLFLTAEYLIEKNAPPPQTFQELFDFGLKNNARIYNIAQDLLKMKKEHPEITKIGRIAELDSYITNKRKELEARILLLAPPDEIQGEVFDNFFTDVLNAPENAEFNKIKFDETDIQKMERFPQDIEYRKQLLPPDSSDDYPLLQSIMGPQEFKQTIEEFNSTPESYSTGKYTDERMGSVVLRNTRDKKFRANLHMHTNHSDGTLTVGELLDAAARYADAAAKKLDETSANKDAPFTIAITDHNTVGGCKEAVEIIKNNPGKYKNLRVILGVEISVGENSAGDYTPAKPYQIHLLAQCINPFDEKLNSILSNIRAQNENPDYANVGNMEEAADAFSNQPNCLLGYAHPLSHQSYKKAPTPQDLPNIIEKLINKFKSAAGNKACFVENYYQSYADDMGQDENLKKQVKEISDKLGLLSTGGLDSHGNSIFAH